MGRGGEDDARQREDELSTADEAGCVFLRKKDDILVGCEGAQVPRGYGALRELGFLWGVVDAVTVLAKKGKVRWVVVGEEDAGFRREIETAWALDRQEIALVVDAQDGDRPEARGELAVIERGTRRVKEGLKATLAKIVF